MEKLKNANLKLIEQAEADADAGERNFLRSGIWLGWYSTYEYLRLENLKALRKKFKTN